MRRMLMIGGCLWIAALTVSAEDRKIEISTVAGLQFSPARFAVEPGQTVVLTLSNPDTMLHNFLLAAPGSREEVARMAMELGAEGAAREYVPESEKVILHSRLLANGESQTLVFQAPEKEGVYPYVCTFPGHSIVMYGAMHVTRSPMPPLAGDLDVPAQIRFAEDDGTAAPVHAHAGGGKPSAPPRADMIQHLKIPEGFEAVTFAQPPEVNYPTALASSADGKVLFVGVDRNSSLGRREGRGLIVRAEDTTGDGQADAFSTFAEAESPRGVVWDGESLYVLHPPDVTRFRDTTGDGVADERELVVAGIGYGIEHQRGADHTTNGIRMGIDGWLYIAVGDFGFEKAVAADGGELQLLGGGVARIRPDGSELELVATGLRNIYDTAISPTLDIFTRDNDNDGQGWDTRLHHITPTAEFGYPRLFTHFTDETLPPIVRYGRGSPTGAFFLDEPGWPDRYNQKLYTAEWNKDVIERHELTADGAGFAEEAREPFLGIPSPTGMVADGRSRLFVASWYRGGFNFGGPDVGFVVRLNPVGIDPEPAEVPDFAALDDGALLFKLGSPGATLRKFAQQEILRRGEMAGPALVRGLQKMAGDANRSVAVRVAALFTLKQLQGARSHEFLLGLVSDDTVREFALRALADRLGEVSDLPSRPFTEALADSDPRVRLQAVVGLGRLGRVEDGEALVARLMDKDRRVAHATEKALVRLNAVEPVFAAFDRGGEDLDGARRVLQQMHRDEVVDGLLARLASDQSRAVRQATLVTLARLYHQEWTGWTMRDWWKTQPDRRGPYYFPTEWARTPDVDRSLRRALAEAADEEAAWLRTELRRHRIAVEE